MRKCRNKQTTTNRKRFRGLCKKAFDLKDLPKRVKNRDSKLWLETFKSSSDFVFFFRQIHDRGLFLSTHRQVGNVDKRRHFEAKKASTCFMSDLILFWTGWVFVRNCWNCSFFKNILKTKSSPFYGNYSSRSKRNTRFYRKTKSVPRLTRSTNLSISSPLKPKHNPLTPSAYKIFRTSIYFNCPWVQQVRNETNKL